MSRSEVLQILDSNAIVGNIPDFLQQIDISSLDLGDLIGAVIASIALIVSAYTFYISHTQASQSEQIKTSRDIWAIIAEKYNKYNEERMEYNKKQGNPEDESEVSEILIKRRQRYRDLLAEIDYFAYLILSGEIKDKVVLPYYEGLLGDMVSKMRTISSTDDRRFSSRSPNLDKLSKKNIIFRLHT
jgi:hypothetical protein